MSPGTPLDIESAGQGRIAASRDDGMMVTLPGRLAKVRAFMLVLAQHASALFHTLVDIRSDRIDTVRRSSLLASVTVGVDTSLFAFFEINASYVNSGFDGNIEIAVKTLAYVALFSSLSTLLSARLLVATVDAPTCSSSPHERGGSGEFNVVPTDQCQRSHRLGAWAKLAYFEWIFSSFTAVLCTIASTATYAFTQELPTAALVVVLIAAVLSGLPLFRFFFIRSCRA